MAVTEQRSKQRIALVRDAHLNQFAKTHNVKESGTMAQQPTPSKSVPSKPNTTPPAQIAKPATNGSAPKADDGKGDKAKKEKRPRVTLASIANPKFLVRMFKADFEAFGAPKGPKGEDMLLKATVPFGGGGRKLTDEEKAARDAAKLAEKARKANMTDEQRLAEAKLRREEKQASKAAKVEKQHADIVAQVMADIAAGKIPGVKLA